MKSFKYFNKIQKLIGENFYSITLYNDRLNLQGHFNSDIVHNLCKSKKWSKNIEPNTGYIEFRRSTPRFSIEVILT